MIYHDYQYLDMLRHIMQNGIDSEDRTGTGTKKVWVCALRFDLEDGFPLLTTKKMHWKSIVYELLWFLRGDTNIKWLNERGVRIWDEWSNSDGELGPVYGHAWRRFGARPRVIPQPKPKLPNGVEATYCGIANGSGSYNHPVGKVWQGMIQRCYSQQNIGYDNYGRRGVHVCDRWLQFSNFAEDYKTLPGWGEDTQERLTLDKDGIGDGFCYSPKHCQWVTDRENICLRSDKIYVVEKEGKCYTFTNPSTFCREQGIPNNNISDLWTGRKNAQTRHGFKLVEIRDRNEGVDQLQQSLDMLKSNPNSRQNLVNAWHPYWVRYSVLPPCHLLFQWQVMNGKLNCSLYQRSCDSFLGVPFNIASYSLLTHIMAAMAGLEVGEFVWIGGDVHIYNNHFEQVEEQLGRQARQSPILTVKDKEHPPERFEDWDFIDFTLSDYNPHPAIKAKVSV
jgi:thymidylate synthase